MKLIFPLLAAASIAPGLLAQSNKVPGRDATLHVVESMRSYGRQGTFPTGMNGFANGVTVCNIGTVDINWRAPMDPDHPVYAPMMFRVVDDRIEQISDWSYVKHGFASINGNACGTCRTFNSSILGPNCSDTYGSGLNADRYWLGPPEEIDPWLGAWDPVGSHFDRGEPTVGGPAASDGRRSLTRTMANQLPPVLHRVTVGDADLNVPGARYFFGMYVVIRGEPGADRDNNWCYRECRPTWSGSQWNFSNVTNPTNGSPLTFWPGASVSSGGNANDDGMFYVGVKVTGPDSRGFWHYEYAVQNRDNHRAGASFRLPICPTARVLNASFRDIDGNAANDWSVQVQNGEIAFMAPATGNVLEWNTIYNFSFDADVGPTQGNARIDQARMGTGAMSVTVPTQVPGIGYTLYLGDGCGSPAPAIHPTGTPATATIPNPSFGILAEDIAPNGSIALFVSLLPANTALGNGCTLYLDTGSSFVHGSFNANSQGVATIPFMVPSNPSLEGASLVFQAAELAPGGPLFGAAELSNGLRVRIGNSTTGCQ